jgi:hypothetical protein
LLDPYPHKMNADPHHWLPGKQGRVNTDGQIIPTTRVQAVRRGRRRRSGDLLQASSFLEPPAGRPKLRTFSWSGRRTRRSQLDGTAPPHPAPRGGGEGSWGVLDNHTVHGGFFISSTWLELNEQKE